MYSCQHESAFFNFPLSAVFGDDVFFLHSSLLISLKALPTAFSFHICIVSVLALCLVEPVPYLYHSTQFAQCQQIINIFSSFSIFSQFIFRVFVQYVSYFFIELTHIFFLLSFFCSTYSAVPCISVPYVPLFRFSLFFRQLQLFQRRFHAFLLRLSVFLPHIS